MRRDVPCRGAERIEIVVTEAGIPVDRIHADCSTCPLLSSALHSDPMDTLEAARREPAFSHNPLLFDRVRIGKLLMDLADKWYRDANEEPDQNYSGALIAAADELREFVRGPAI